MPRLFKPRQIRPPNERLWVFLSIFLLWSLFSLHLSGHLNIPSYLSLSPYSPTINLVLSSTTITNLTWTTSLTLPNTRIIRYVADDPTAPFHPPANKGREALIYLSYFYHFYDRLPDISILVHGNDEAGHVDEILQGSMVYVLNQLDVKEVKRRKYVNLRVNWGGVCEEGINTTFTTTTTTSLAKDKAVEPGKGERGPRFEEAFMREAFIANFPNDLDIIPEILAQPCCSQFAVTRNAVRSLPREQYRRHIDWILRTQLDDHISGKIWEYLWQFLFLKRGVDCPVEYKALCRGWAICFESKGELEAWNELARHLKLEREELSEALRTDVANLPRLQRLRDEIAFLEAQLRERKDMALERGRSETWRYKIAGDL